MTWGGIGYIGRNPIAFLDGNQDSQCYQRTLERSLLPYLVRTDDAPFDWFEQKDARYS